MIVNTTITTTAATVTTTISSVLGTTYVQKALYTYTAFECNTVFSFEFFFFLLVLLLFRFFCKYIFYFFSTCSRRYLPFLWL